MFNLLYTGVGEVHAPGESLLLGASSSLQGNERYQASSEGFVSLHMTWGEIVSKRSMKLFVSIIL